MFSAISNRLFPQVDESKGIGHATTRDLKDALRILKGIVPEKEIIEGFNKPILIAGRNEIPLAGLASTLDLRILKNQSPEKTKQIVDLFDLGAAVKLIEKQGYDFEGTIRYTHLDVLATTSIYELQLMASLDAFELVEPVFRALAELYLISLDQFEYKTKDEKRKILIRLECVEKNNPPEGDFPALTVGWLRQRNPVELKIVLPSLSYCSLDALSQKQLETLDYSAYSGKKLADVVRRKPEIFKTPEAINFAVQKIAEESLYLTPIHWFSQIDLEPLSPDRINQLFSGGNREKKIEQLSIRNLNHMAQKIYSFYLGSIPHKDRLKIAIGSLSAESLCDLLPFHSPEAMALLPQYDPEEINRALPKLRPGHMQHLSNAQLQALDTTKCTEEQTEAFFPNPDPLSDYRYEYSEVVRGELTHFYGMIGGFTSFTETEIKKMNEQRQKEIHKLKLFSEEQIRGFKSLTPKQKKMWENAKN